MKENAYIKFYTTSIIKEKITAKAKRVGMSVKNYIIHLCLNVELKVSVEGH